MQVKRKMSGGKSAHSFYSAPGIYHLQINGGWLTHLSAGVVSQSEISSDQTSILKEKSKAG